MTKQSFWHLLFDRRRDFRSIRETALAAGGADAMKKERCERDAMLHRYMGKQRSRFIKQCLASSNRLPGRAAARPSVPPSDQQQYRGSRR